MRFQFYLLLKKNVEIICSMTYFVEFLNNNLLIFLMEWIIKIASVKTSGFFNLFIASWCIIDNCGNIILKFFSEKTKINK